MNVNIDRVREVLREPAALSWAKLLDNVCSAFTFHGGVATAAEINKQDRAVGKLDLLLSSAAWDLWRSYSADVPRTADRLANWWAERPAGRAVLILDGLSLRELPWILAGANARNYIVHRVDVTGAELPADTTSFARALGAPTRGSLENRGATASFRLSGAATDVTGVPFADALGCVPTSADVFLWHTWPDDRLHELAKPGLGLDQLAAEAKEQLGSDGFWALIHKLTQGRRLIITADHGYAASGLFPDVQDEAQAKWLRDLFKAQRYAAVDGDIEQPWLPPLAITLQSQHGRHAFALGRRRWKVPGGHPALTHGGLSLLEVAVPFVELSRPAGV